MLEQIVETKEDLPFYFEQIENILVSNSSVVTDLFFLEEINALVLKDFPVFTNVPRKPSQAYIEIQNVSDLVKLEEYCFSQEMVSLLKEFLSELETTLIGVQVSPPSKEMCPSFHGDKLPLRIVQCLDGPGTTLQTLSGKEIHTEKNDLILLKGEMWKSEVGAIIHRSPTWEKDRRLLRIDFLD